MPTKTESPSVGRRSKTAWIAAISVAAAALAGGITFFATRSDSTPKIEPTPISYPSEEGVPLAQAGCRPVETPLYQGHHELHPGDKHPAYSSEPPSSGWYLIVNPNTGYYEIPLPIERIMAVPAQGGVAIYVSKSEKTPAKRFSIALSASDVITTVWPTVKQGVVFTAWGVLQRCEKFSGEAAVAFIQRYKKTALKEREPNFVPGSRPTSLDSPSPSPSN